MNDSSPRRRRRPRALVAALAALATLATMLVGVAGASTASAAGSTIVGVASQRCLDVVGQSHTNKARVNIYDCNGQSNQGWTLTAAGELKVYDAVTCLDVAGQSTTAGAIVQIYSCNGGQNQKWRLNSNGTITAQNSGLCLDVTGNASANSTLVGLWTCNGQNNQRWTSPLFTPDATPPSVPGNARVSNLVCDAVTFSWNASNDNVGVAYYDVYHDGQQIKTVSGSTLTTDLPVVAGVRWGLYVNARDAAGNVSQASTTVYITPPVCQIDTTPPSAPTNLAGTASGTTVTLTWTHATDNIGVRAYDIYRNGAKVGTNTGTATLLPNNTFVDSTLAASTTYAYYVVARDAQLNYGPSSSTVNVRTGTACGSSICEVTQIGTDKDIPWGLVTLPDGQIMYSRRDAQNIVKLNPTTGATLDVGTVPNVQSTDGEGGLMGLAIAATYSSDHWLYIMHTTPTDNRIVRIKVENDKLNLSTEQVLVSGILRNKFHNGGRLRFGPDGKLYASTGDAQNGDNAQNRNGLNGKVLRMNTDGSVPSDNPFGNLVWSYGHRNPQGLAFDSQGRLWEQEFGNGIMDETNLITKGGNYGWPACEGTSGTCGTAGYIAPKRTYPTSEGSCSGIAIVRDVVYVACERGTRLVRTPIVGDALPSAQSYFNGTYGRIRTVEPAPDGGLWMTTTNLGDKDSIANNSDERLFHVTLGS